MNKKLRNSGIYVIGEVSWGTHFCLFYQTKEDLTDMLIPYFKAGLENNEFCLWIIPNLSEVEEAKEALRRIVPDFCVYLEKGQIEIIPYTHWYVKEGVFDSQRVLNGWLEKLNNALESGYDGMRIIGDASWLEKSCWNNLVNYEEDIDRIINNCQIIALCTYPLDRFNATETIDVVINHQFALIKRGGKLERIENSGRKNITPERKWAENALCHEQRFRLKSESILSPAQETANLELSEIVNAQEVQSLMDDFYKFAPITLALVDLKGNIPVGVGWQDICTRFHRVHPEACKYCIESDTELSAGVAPGEFKLYKCKNNMWDVATPITVDGQHVGNVFGGQFFFEDEPLDYELFRSQARKYGFDEEEYIAALEKVPRLSRKAVDTIMTFLTKLANMLSHLSYSNVKLAQSLVERDALVDALRESEERFRSILENSIDAAYRRNLQTDRYDYMSLAVEQITGFSVQEMNAMSINEVLDRVHPDDRPLVAVELAQAFDKGLGTLEYRFKCKNGQYRWFADHFKVIKDHNGKPLFSGGIVRDITENKQAEEALIRSEKRFRTLAENFPDIISRFDRQNRHIYVNPAAEEPYGHSQEEIIGKTHTELGMDPEKVKFWEEHHEKVFTTGNPEIMEFHYISPQGKEYYFNTRIVPEFVEGKATSVLAISRDVTDVKEAEAKLKETLDNLESLVKERTAELQNAYNSLRESEKSLAEAQKMARIGNWDWNVLAGKVYWSDELYRIFGLNPEEVGLLYNEFLKYVHPNDRDYVNGIIKKNMDEKFYSVDFRIISADGAERIVHAENEVIFEEENIPVRMRGVVQDITERKIAEQKLQQSEAKYRSFIENFKGIAFEVDENFIPLFLHGTIEEITGYREKELILKRPWKEVIHPEDLPRIYEEMKKVRDSKNLCSGEIDFRIVHRSGKIKWVHEIYQEIPGGDGSPNKYQGAIYDITERKEAEEALANIETARQKEIHHRIKNNLQVISSLLDLEAEKFKNREHVENSEVLEAFKESQDRVLSMALIHEELHEGEEIDTLNFSQYLERLVENLFQTYRFGNTDISLNTDLEENVFFDMDIAVPLGIIVNELVSNSFKHAFPGADKGIIQIKLLKNENAARMNKKFKKEASVIENNSFTLIISDNGVGISENLDLEQSDTLGIQLVTTLVDQLNGSLELKRDSGTEFVIRFRVTEKGKEEPKSVS
jgi:PAS domain S-box-containing protein